MFGSESYNREMANSGVLLLLNILLHGCGQSAILVAFGLSPSHSAGSFGKSFGAFIRNQGFNRDSIPSYSSKRSDLTFTTKRTNSTKIVERNLPRKRGTLNDLFWDVEVIGELIDQ